MGICHLEAELWNSSSPAGVENKERCSRASLGTHWVLTLAAGSVVAWGTLVTVRSLEVGFTHAHPHPRVLPTGVALRATRVAIAVWGHTTGDTTHSRQSSSQLPQGQGRSCHEELKCSSIRSHNLPIR